MNAKATSLWVLVAVVLSAIAWWPRVGGPVVEEGPRPLLAAGELPVERIDEIRLVRDEGDSWVFRREGAAWRQVEPFEVPVESFSMRQHAVAAEALRSSRRLDAADRPRDEQGGSIDLGLEPPLGRVTFAWNDPGAAPGASRRELTLDLGRRSVAGRAWLRRGGDGAVHAVDAGLHARLLDGDPRTWRSKRLLPIAEEPIDRIEVGGAGQARPIELVRENARWRLESPFSTRLDADAVEAWLAALGRAECSAFFEDEPEDLARYGLDQPAEVISLERRVPSPEGGEVLEREEVRLGGPFGPGSPDRFAMVAGRPCVLLVGEEATAILRRPIAALVDPTGTDVAPADVRTIEVRTAAETFRLRRELDGFVAERIDERGEVSDAVPARRGAAEGLLAQLCEARAPEVAVTPFPQERLAALVILGGFDGRPLGAVRIARDPADGRWAIDDGDDVLRVFPASLEPRLRGEDYGLSPLEASEAGTP